MNVFSNKLLEKHFYKTNNFIQQTILLNQRLPTILLE